MNMERHVGSFIERHRMPRHLALREHISPDGTMPPTLESGDVPNLLVIKAMAMLYCPAAQSSQSLNLIDVAQTTK